MVFGYVEGGAWSPVGRKRKFCSILVQNLCSFGNYDELQFVVRFFVWRRRKCMEGVNLCRKPFN